MSNYHLVIQGPIISKGITGKTYLDFQKGVKDQSIVSHNCLRDIQQTIEQFGALCKSISISTWEDEPINDADLPSHPALKLSKLKRLDSQFTSKSTPTGQVNLLRQFHSFKEGIKDLQNVAEDDFIIKLRTDQFLNLQTLIDEHQSCSEEVRNRKIFIPFFLKSRNTISDFYFVGTAKNMIALCDAVLDCPQYPEINLSISSVHQIIPVAYFQYIGKLTHPVRHAVLLKSFTPAINRFGTAIHNCSVAKDVSHLLDHYFQCLSADVLYNSSWRGDLMLPDTNHAFQPDLKFGKDIPLTTKNLFVYLSPKHYLNSGAKVNLKVLGGLFYFAAFLGLPFFKKKTLAKYSVNG